MFVFKSMMQHGISALQNKRDEVHEHSVSSSGGSSLSHMLTHCLQMESEKLCVEVSA